jgi:hypothetical protein
MKRFHAAALAAVLAAPVWAQSPARPDVITLTGPDGKSPHACTVLRTYKHSSGGTAMEVRDQVTNEIVTVVENASPDAAKAATPAELTTELAKPTDVPKGNAPAKAQTPVKADQAYTRPPVPATRRWLGWLRSDPAAKPVPTTARRTPSPAPPTETVAMYHPDPVIRLIACLNDELLPSMREVSAEALARNAKDRPEVVEAIVKAAHSDPAPSVRVCCCRCLVEMQIRTPECLTALKSLQDDREQMVRTAAAAALTVLEPQ